MNPSRTLAVAVSATILAAGTAAHRADAQTYAFGTVWPSGGSYMSGPNSSTFFDITAMHPDGIMIQGFDVRSYGAAGTVFTAEVYHREGGYAGFEKTAAAWSLLGSAQTASTGRSTPTPLPVGGLAISGNTTLGICINHVNAGTWFSPLPNPPTFSNDHVRIEVGAGQQGLFAGSLYSNNNVSVNVYYTLGTAPAVGACCLPDSTCDIRSEHLCVAAGGSYEGNGTVCTSCVSGACCLRDGSCTLASPDGCDVLLGIYQGDGTVCGNVPCPQPGACCLPTGCVILAEARCDELEGQYTGHGVGCAQANCAAAQLAHIVIPRDLTDLSVGGGGTALSRNNNSATLQMVIAASEFDRLPPGSELTGITWRIASAAGFNQVWPSTNGTYSLFDIEVATAMNPPGQMSHTFADNVGPDALLVRQGTLTIPAFSFPGGTAPPTANDFGWVIPFATPFVYNGGDVVITIRRTAGSAAYTTHDIVGPNHAHLGYGSLFQAIQNTISNIAPTANTISPEGAFFIPKITFAAPAAPPCYANCDGSTTAPILNVEDFICFVAEFAAASLLPPEQQLTHYANCDGSTTPPMLNVEDFTCFVSAFAAGCP
jgi:hypothetical protein